MGPVAGFIAALLVTVGFLVGAALTGRFRRIRAHVLMVLGSVVSLGVAIYYALSVGDVYDLEAGRRRHAAHQYLEGGLAPHGQILCLRLPVIDGMLGPRLGSVHLVLVEPDPKCRDRHCKFIFYHHGLLWVFGVQFDDAGGQCGKVRIQPTV